MMLCYYELRIFALKESVICRIWKAGNKEL